SNDQPGAGAGGQDDDVPLGCLHVQLELADASVRRALLGKGDLLRRVGSGVARPGGQHAAVGAVPTLNRVFLAADFPPVLLYAQDLVERLLRRGRGGGQHQQTNEQRTHSGRRSGQGERRRWVRRSRMNLYSPSPLVAEACTGPESRSTA